MAGMAQSELMRSDCPRHDRIPKIKFVEAVRAADLPNGVEEELTYWEIASSLMAELAMWVISFICRFHHRIEGRLHRHATRDRCCEVVLVMGFSLVAVMLMALTIAILRLIWSDPLPLRELWKRGRPPI